MFDFEGIFEKQVDKIKKKFDIDTDPIFTPRFKKIFNFMAYKFFPFVLNIATFIILLRILYLISNRTTPENAILVALVIIILTLRSIGQTLKKPIE